MKKEKFHIEYVLDKVSRSSLWNHLTTKYGLEQWFADNVTLEKNIYTFSWGKEEKEKAEIVDFKNEIYIRLRWLTDTDPNAYIEFIIRSIELTGTISLEITDFAKKKKKADSIELWDLSVDRLKRSLGI